MTRGGETDSELIDKASHIAASLAAPPKALHLILTVSRALHVDDLHTAASSVSTLIEKVSGLSIELEARGHSISEIKADLSQILGSSISNRKKEKPSTSMKSRWAVETLQASAECSISGTAELGAIFILGLIDHQEGRKPCPSRSAIERLGAIIRGIDSKGGAHPARRHLLGVPCDETLKQFAANFGTSLARQGQPQQLAKDWGGWLEWIHSARRPPAWTAPNQPEVHPTRPTSGPGPKPNKSRESLPSLIRKPTRLVPPPADPIQAPEPLEEAAGRTDFISRKVARPLQAQPSAGQEKSLCFQEIRQRNRDLLTTHIEVLSKPELDSVIASINREFDAALEKGEHATAAAVAVYQLCIATGRSPSRLLKACVSRIATQHATPDLQLDLDEGCIRQRLYRPDSPQQAHPRNCDILEKVQDWIAIPLPPSIVNKFRTLDQIRGAKQVGDWFGDKQPSVVIEAMLGGIPNVQNITRSIARARRWLAPAIVERAMDDSVAMLICGDSFGRSTAPLYYYAPLLSHLRRIYMDSVWPAFGDSGVELPNDTIRVGSQVLPKQDRIRAGFRRLHAGLNITKQKILKWESREFVPYHNRLVEYVLSHFCFITTHRPTEAIFEVARGDMDLDLRICVISDKKVDAAHIHRLTALSEKLTLQLRAFQDHLAALLEQAAIPQELRDALENALAGKEGLFFFISEDGKPLRKIEAWSQRWPEEWQGLPTNWHRHFMATHLREAGAAPAFVHLQMGHLESAGFLFSDASALSPSRFAEGLAAALSSIESLLDFRIRRGLEPTRSSCPVEPPRSWTAKKRAHEKALRKFEIARKLAIRSMRHNNQADGLALGLRLLSPICPDLAERIRTLPKGRYEPEALPNAELDKLRISVDQANQFMEALEDEPAQPIHRVCAHLQISRAIRRLRRAYKLKCADIGMPYAYSPAEPTPFFPGMMVATAQKRRLRHAFLEQARVLREQEPHLFLALMATLFEGISSGEELMAVLKRDDANSLVDIAGPQLLLHTEGAATSGGEAFPIVTGIGGAAALGFATITRPPTLSPPDSAQLSTALHSRFGTILGHCQPAEALSVLLEITEIANRLEYSGLSRFTCSPKGCSPARRDIQEALLTGSLVGVAEVPAQVLAHIGPEVRHPSEGVIQTSQSSTHLKTKKDAQRFLSHLWRNWSASAYSGQGVGEIYIKGLRLSLQNFCDSIVVGDHLLIEHAVAYFALDIALHGTPERKDPAPSTIHTYVTSIASDLIDQLAGLNLLDIDSESLTDVYLDILREVTNPSSAARKAAQLLRFHRLLEKRFGLEPVDHHAFGDYLSVSERSVTADSITSAEYDAARKWLSASIEAEGPIPLAGSDWRRQRRIARLALDLLYWTGARISEIALLRHSDIFLESGHIVIFIRPHRHRRSKTRAARRRVQLQSRDAEQVCIELQRWIDGERQRLGGDRRPGHLLFPGLNDPDESCGVNQVRRLISEAFGHGAGRHCWPHLLRHHFAFERVMVEIARAIATAHATPESLVDIDRRLKAIATCIGHTVITTTSSCYLHLPWLLRSIESRSLAQDWGRKEIFAATNLTLGNVDKLGQREANQADSERFLFATPGGSWPDRVLIRNAKILVRTRKPPHLSPVPVPLSRISLVNLERLLRVSDGPRDLERIGALYGLSSGDVSALLCAINELEQLTGYGLLSLEGSRPRIVPRRIEDLGVGTLLEQLDGSPPDELHKVGFLFRRCYGSRAAARENQLVGDENFVLELDKVLTSHGVQEIKLGYVPPSTRRQRSQMTLGFTSEDGVTPFDHLVWLMAICAVFVMSGGSAVSGTA